MDGFRIIGIVFVCIVILIIGFLVFGNRDYLPFISKESRVIIKNHTFFVEIAQTDTQKEKGLSGRPALQNNHGMYFPFRSPDFYAFWMKDMMFSIDILYIANGKIVAIFPNNKPNSNPYDTVIKPSEPIDSVLEINAGIAQKYNFQVGDSVRLYL